MKVTDEIVRNIAELARLQVGEAEVAALARGMENILELAEQMQSADTGGVEPLSSPLDVTQRLRPDEVTEGDQRALFQAIAPATEDGLYLVPRVVE